MQTGKKLSDLTPEQQAKLKALKMELIAEHKTQQKPKKSFSAAVAKAQAKK